MVVGEGGIVVRKVKGLNLFLATNTLLFAPSLGLHGRLASPSAFLVSDQRKGGNAS
jgi:hypothetical protein